MAKVKLNPLFKEMHGKVGDLVFRRGPNGQTIVYKAPKKSRGNTRFAQKVQQHRMRDAHAYAHAAMADPDKQAHYEQQSCKLGKSAYSLALSDYWKLRREMEK
jgi:hypothetical protein